MTALVTGAAGSIGRRIIDQLIGLGANDIRSLTNNPTLDGWAGSIWRLCRQRSMRPWGWSVQDHRHGLLNARSGPGEFLEDRPHPTPVTKPTADEGSQPMRTTRQLSITLPNEISDGLHERARSGEYASESDVIRRRAPALFARDKAVEAPAAQWLAVQYDALMADPSRAVTAKDLQVKLAVADCSVGVLPGMSRRAQICRTLMR